MTDGIQNIDTCSKLLNLIYISLLGNIQYAGQMTSGVAQPQSPSTAKTEMNPGVLVQNSTAGHVQVVDSSHVVTSAGDANNSNNNSNRSRGRGGRGRGKSTGRGRRSTSGPGPEIDHNIEVNTVAAKIINLFKFDGSKSEQCCVAHIVHNGQQYCTVSHFSLT